MQMLEKRIPPPLVAGVIGLAMWGLSPVQPGLEASLSVQIAMFIAALLGVIFGILGVIAFRQAKTTADPFKPETASTLVKSGIYRVSRNPMYLGLALLLLAWAIYLGSVWSLLGIVVFVHYMNRFQIIPEEEAMEKLFGQEYRVYKAKVRRWL